jgi:micrococcal nuclease
MRWGQQHLPQRKPGGLAGLLALGAIGVVGLLSVAAPGSPAGVSATVATVRSVYDGDTLTLVGGEKVRLVQIDTPELGSGECYSRAARKALVAIVPIGSRITLEADPTLDRVDRYGRLLRYVRRGAVNVNLELVRRGAAAPYFYEHGRGRHAATFMRAARAAKASRRGLWAACPRTRLDPYRQVDTGTSGPPVRAPAAPAPAAAPLTTTTPNAAASTSPAGSSCAASYPGVCIPPPPPDLDCKDVQYRRFAVRWDVPDPDPHHFDGDRDGIGCETG